MMHDAFQNSFPGALCIPEHDASQEYYVSQVDCASQWKIEVYYISLVHHASKEHDASRPWCIPGA